MKYDDASWHSGGDFPKELPADAAVTHTGLFVAWAWLAGLGSDESQDDFAEDVRKLSARLIAPCQVYRNMDGKFTDEDLSEEGNAFAATYFDFDSGQYLKDYEKTLCNGLSTMYHCADSWENYDALKRILDMRLAQWRAGRK